MADVESSVGSGKDYETLVLWEAAKEGDLVTATQHQIANYFGGTTEDLTIDGSTTNASYYMEIRRDSSISFDKTPDDGAILKRSSAAGYAIDVRDDYFKVHGIVIDANNTGATTAKGCIYLRTANYFEIYDCVLYHWDSRYAINISSYYDSTPTYVYNNIFIAGEYTAGTHAVFPERAGNTMIAYHNTIINTDGACICVDNGTVVSKNNIAQNSTGTDCYQVVDGSFDGNSDCNISSDDSDTGGGNDQNNVSLTFANAAGDDYHLDSTDTEAIGQGEDLQPDGDGNLNVTTDIDGDSRDATTPDIGADEYVGGGSSSSSSSSTGSISSSSSSSSLSSSSSSSSPSSSSSSSSPSSSSSSSSPSSSSSSSSPSSSSSSSSSPSSSSSSNSPSSSSSSSSPSSSSSSGSISSSSSSSSSSPSSSSSSSSASSTSSSSSSSSLSSSSSSSSQSSSSSSSSQSSSSSSFSFSSSSSSSSPSSSSSSSISSSSSSYSSSSSSYSSSSYSSSSSSLSSSSSSNSSGSSSSSSARGKQATYYFGVPNS